MTVIKALRPRHTMVVVILNVLVLLAFAAGLAYVVTIVPLGPGVRAMELDRAGVINKTKLKEAFPDVGVPGGENLGEWIAKDEHQAAVGMAWVGIAASALNILVILLVTNTDRRSQEMS